MSNCNANNKLHNKHIKSKQVKKSKDSILISSNNDPSKYDYINPNTLYITDPTQLNTKISKLIKKRLIDIIHDGKLDFESIILKRKESKSKKIVSQYILNLSNVLDALTTKESDCLKIIRKTLIDLKIINLIESEELYNAFDDMIYDLIYDIKTQVCYDYKEILESIN